MGSENIKSTVKEMLYKLEENKYINEEEAIEFGLQAYSLCKNENYELGMAFALLHIGEACANMSKYEKAMTYLFDSIKISQKLNVCDLQLLAYKNIGNIYFYIGEYEKSLEYYNTAKKLTKIITHSKNYYKDFSAEFYDSKLLNNIGEIYRMLKCYDDAIRYYNLSDELDKKLNYQATFGTVLSNMGYVEYNLGDYDKALEYLNKGLKYLLKNDYKGGMLEAYGLFALIYEKKGNYKLCESYFSKAINISTEIAYDYSRIDLLLDFSNFLKDTGKIESAIDKLNEVYNISVDNKMYAKTMKICKRTIKLYEEINDINNANKYCNLYFENEKKLENIDLENRVKNLKTKLKLDSLEKENKSILEKSEAFRKKSEDLIEIIKKISIISELGEKVTTTLDLNQIYEMLHLTIQNFIQVNVFGVALYDEDNRKIKYKYHIENNKKIETHEIDFDNQSSMAVKCLRENKIIVINDMHNEYLNYVDDLNYIVSNKNNCDLNSAIYCPLIIGNTLIGVMTIQANDKDSFTMLTIETIKALSSYATIAINNAIKSMNLVDEVDQRRKVQIELENMNDKLIYLSENDGLTNIPNRRKFDTTMAEEWNKAMEISSVISMIIFDIDCFKQYNDNYGHTDGDNCLIKISACLNESLIEDYFAARYGGDEFVVILPDTNLDQAIKFGENFRRNVEKLCLPNEFSKVKDIVTVTLGVSSVMPSDEITIIQFIRNADNALYEAKNKGRNQTVGYAPVLTKS